MTKAALTRQAILKKAFEVVYTSGYGATSVDTIIAAANLTKGAFYYHFRNKDEMGLALIEEVLKPTLKRSFEQAFAAEANPLNALYNLMRYLLLQNDFLQPAYGCPAANLTQELSPWHPAFSEALNGLTQEWNQLMTAAIEKGKKDGFIKAGVSARAVTTFMVAGYWGARSLGKLDSSAKVYADYLKELKRYLTALQ